MTHDYYLIQYFMVLIPFFHFKTISVMKSFNVLFFITLMAIGSTYSSCIDETDASLEQSLTLPGGGQQPGNPPNGSGDNSNSDATYNTSSSDCTKGINIDHSRGECSEVLSFQSSVSISVNGQTRTIRANNIPDHLVGIFGGGPGSLNPNAISAQNSTYSITTNPQFASRTTDLLGLSGPEYSFGVLLNGVEVDPVAAEPWPHVRGSFANVNWAWNLEAINISIGLDCNNAHVQPTGKYHYHGLPTLYLSQINANSNEMTLLGYAADGFPIYNKYGFMNADNANSPLIEMIPSFRLKSGDRPGDGVDAPCGTYNGIYSNDYEYIPDLGHLDECNGRTGVTPDYPDGTYYYVITESFPSIPRCFVGTPSSDFKIGF